MSRGLVRVIPLCSQSCPSQCHLLVTPVSVTPTAFARREDRDAERQGRHCCGWPAAEGHDAFGQLMGSATWSDDKLFLSSHALVAGFKRLSG